jgi:uncharacterized protein DUF1360
MFVVVSLAAWRTWHLAAEDDILNRPRRWVVKHGPSWADELIECPYCLGFWISLAYSAAWWAVGDDLRFVVVPLAVAAVVPIIQTCLNAMISGE